jgi:hypothetical protein
MINVDMTVREAITLIQTIPNDLDGENLRNRLIKAIEIAAGDANTNLTVHTMPIDRKVRVIAAIRRSMGWGLKECNDWCKVVTGKDIQTAVGTKKFDSWGEMTQYETHYEGGKPNTLSASSKVINDLAIALREIGCKVTTG